MVSAGNIKSSIEQSMPRFQQSQSIKEEDIKRPIKVNLKA
jgi:hypothetical protein